MIYQEGYVYHIKDEYFEKVQVQKYGKCLTIVIGEFDEKKAAFLLQNMFPGVGGADIFLDFRGSERS